MSIRIEAFDPRWLPDAAVLAARAWQRERAVMPLLPGLEDVNFDRELAGILADGLPMVAAWQGDRLVGYLGGWPVDALFSSHKGVYTPHWAHAAEGEDREAVVFALYTTAAGAWVARGHLSHAVTVLAHDEEALRLWGWLGFGPRCVDAMRPLTPPTGLPATGVEARRATPADIALVLPLHRAHGEYYPNAPLFMPLVEMEDAAGLAGWMEKPGNALWLALRGSEALCYMMTTDHGMCHAANDAGTVNICGAFTSPQARGAGAATTLLAAIVQWAQGAGFQRLGVDYESFNPAGGRFWRRHFTAYTSGMHRMVDDRIVGMGG